MKGKIRWLVATLAFIIVGLAVFEPVNEVLRIKIGARTDMIHSFYLLDKNSVDVVSFGSSHNYHAIQPNVLWEKYGITSYVMGSPGQSVASSYYLMKETLRYQKPKVMLLETYCMRDSKKYRGEARLRQAFDGIRLGRAKIEMVEDFFPDYSWKDKLPYYFPFLRDHARWTDLSNGDFNHDPFLRGGILSFTQAPQPEMEMPEPRELSDLIVSYLDKIVALCEENDVQLVFYAAPIGPCSAYERAQGANLSLEVYAAEKGVPFLFYQKMDPVIDFQTDFCDKQHLNSYGAEKISTHIGEWMIQNYGLADHRQQEGYEKWQEDYERYLEMYRSMRES